MSIYQAKFRVGDRVRCVRRDTWDDAVAEPGREGVVTRVPEGAHGATWFVLDGDFNAYNSNFELVQAPPRTDPLEYLKARLTEVSSGELERMLRECFGLRKNVATKLIVSFEATAE